MTGQPEPAGEPRVDRCPDCRERGVIVVRSVFGPEVAIERVPYPYGDLVVTKLGSGWGVRDFVPGEAVPTPVDRRRRRHVCSDHPYRCMVPGCEWGARLLAGGTFCEDHSPPAIVLCG